MKKFNFESVVNLSFPKTEEQIRDAYITLPSTGKVDILCNQETIETILIFLERAGFFALEVASFDQYNPICRIYGYKGKDGPCYDTGRSAQLESCFAALDDDHHLIRKKFPICEKTATIYDLPFYQKHITISKEDPSKGKTTPPIDFDCATFSEDIASLYNQLKKNTSETSEDSHHITVFYQGPFKFLIFEDGTLVKRGVFNTVPKYLEGQLKNHKTVSITECSSREIFHKNFIQEYEKDKGAFLLTPPSMNSKIQKIEAHKINFSKLSQCSKEFISKLSMLINDDDNYLLLTGSDPLDSFGCCPAQEVGYASRLVEAGVLECFRTNDSPDSCPCTIFTFRNELSIVDGHPQFTRNKEFREKVKKELTKNNSVHNKKKGLVYVLFSFIALSIIVTIINKPHHYFKMALSSPSHEEMNKVNFENGYHLILLHLDKICKSCENITTMAEDLHAQHQKKIHFHKVNVESPTPKDSIITNRFFAVATTIIILNVEDSVIKQKEIHNLSLAKLADSEEKLKVFLEKRFTLLQKKSHYD